MMKRQLILFAVVLAGCGDSGSKNGSEEATSGTAAETTLGTLSVSDTGSTSEDVQTSTGWVSDSGPPVATSDVPTGTTEFVTSDGPTTDNTSSGDETSMSMTATQPPDDDDDSGTGGNGVPAPGEPYGPCIPQGEPGFPCGGDGDVYLQLVDQNTNQLVACTCLMQCDGQGQCGDVEGATGVPTCMTAFNMQNQQVMACDIECNVDTDCFPGQVCVKNLMPKNFCIDLVPTP